MAVAVADVRMGVILDLQHRFRQTTPGTPWADRLEKALSLALSTRRRAQSTSFLLHDVLRDAARIRARQQARMVFAVDEALLSTPPQSDPFTIVATNEFLGRLGVAVRDIHPQADACLESLSEGEAVDACAHRLRLSARQVKYVRLRIRRIAEHLWSEEVL